VGAIGLTAALFVARFVPESEVRRIAPRADRA
jgi:hypothetical protein